MSMEVKKGTRLSVGAAAAAAALALPGAGMAHTATAANGLRLETTLGPVQPLTPADEVALYGRRTPVVASWGRRGCRIAYTHAKYTSHGEFAYWLDFRSRFCWDKRRRKAVQRGFQDTDYHIAPGFRWVFGYSMAEHGPVKPAPSQRWHGARKGMTHMIARFKMEAGRPIHTSDWTVYLSQHGHYDGTMYDHQYGRK